MSVSSTALQSLIVAAIEDAVLDLVEDNEDAYYNNGLRAAARIVREVIAAA